MRNKLIAFFVYKPFLDLAFRNSSHMAFIFLCFKVMSYINVPPDRKKEKEVEPQLYNSTSKETLTCRA